MTHREDDLIDARLRDVPVPAGIAGRVAPPVLFDDAAIDRLLVRVNLPVGLEDRVRRATASMRAGVTLPLPGEPQSVRQTGPQGYGGGRPASSVRRMRLWSAAMDLLADGGAVAAALSIVTLMFFAGTELSRRLAAPAQVERRVAVRTAAAVTPPASVSPSTQVVEAGVRSGEQASGGSQARAARAPSAPADGVAAVGSGGVPDVARPVAARDAGVEVRAAPAFPLTPAPDREGGASGIRTVFLPTAGRQVPRVPGFDIAFEMAHGESPFVDPSLSATLAVDHPPLSLRTDSFDTLCESARREGGKAGRRPRRGGMPMVRAEEILAALPAAPETDASSGAEVRLSINAVRSLRVVPTSLLVEVCATAPSLAGGGVAAAQADPLDAMLLLDQSAGPFASLSWQWLCRGLDRVISQMRPADRLSLIVCGERPRLVALRADAASLAALLPELTREAVARSADFDAAFRLATAVGRREGRPDRLVVAAHADSLERCRQEGRAALSAWLAELAADASVPAARTPEFVLVDPQEPRPAGGSAALAVGRIPADPVAIGRAMVARVFGRPTLLATGCRLDVAFDPAHVGSYRIVGHRQSAADAVADGEPRSIELHFGETARVVYEVIRRPGDAAAHGADLMSATLTWTPADSGLGGLDAERHIRAVLADGAALATEHARSSTADVRAGLPSPQGCELLLAVALGELAGASVHAEPWRQSAAGIAGLATRWRARGDVTPLGGLLIDCLENQGVFTDAASR
jgi:hypothetical protein